MEADKRSFYEKAAKGLAASTKLYGVDTIVHVENTDDIWFWQQLLSKYRNKRYKFMPATNNEKGNRTAGCEQCLKYKEFLSQKFFICIDSDLRYLLGEELSAEMGILQTYTYSWENHCAFAVKLQNSFDYLLQGERPFDFCSFLRHFSEIVYKPLLLMLYQERNGLYDFRRNTFNRAISLQYRNGDEQANGATFLQRLTENLHNATNGLAEKCGINYKKEIYRYKLLGLHETNAYLYVRGHCLYDSLISIGMKLCENTRFDFEQNILKSALAFEKYDEINKIKSDIEKLNALRAMI